MSKKSSTKEKLAMDAIAVESAIQVAKYFKVAVGTVCDWATKDKDWTSILYRCVRGKKEKVEDEDYFFAPGTMHRHKGLFPKRSTTKRNMAIEVERNMLIDENLRLGTVEAELQKVQALLKEKGISND